MGYQINHIKHNINTSGSNQLNSLAHLELIINRNIFLPVKVSQGDLQLVRLLAGQSVEVVKAKPTLSLKIIRL